MGLTNKSTGINILKNMKVNSNNYTIALAGNPNVGKSTIFNSLTGMNQHTGNWPGKTVEVAYGKYKYIDKEYTLVDLPGTYSLFSKSKEEEITRDFICFEKHNLTIIVLDSTLLERNLNLATSIMQTNDNIIICLNLSDEAFKKGIKINIEKLKSILNVPILQISANKKSDINKLKKQIEKSCNEINSNELIIKYNSKIEDVINKVKTVLEKYSSINNNRFFAIKLLENNKSFNNKIYDYLNIKKESIYINDVINNCHSYLIKNNIDFHSSIVNEVIQNNNLIYKSVINNYESKTPFLDKIITSKIFGIPLMILFLSFILWLTITGANYPSELLSKLLFRINDYIYDILTILNTPLIIKSLITDGIIKTLCWIISVMLPPMAIFFPLFTLLEDAGFLPRIAFNLDKLYQKAKCHGKQALTMCMGFGCNACGVIGCRIIDSKRERLIGILTNSFVPCNGRFPALIAIISMFLVTGKYKGIKASIILTSLLVLSIFITLIVSKILSKTILKGFPSSFLLEMPDYRKPQIKKVIIRSIFDRTLFVLKRAIIVAIPSGIIIWIISNITINNISVLNYLINILDPFAKIFGLTGTILIAFILGMPANEIVIPIMIMSYLNSSSLTNYGSLYELKNIFINNGWTIKTAICTIIFILFHFPCMTTVLTIKKETNSKLWTILSFLLPTITGLIICFIINLLFKLF